jgi:hypothetical protein
MTEQKPDSRIEDSQVAHDMGLLMDQGRDAEQRWRNGGPESQLHKSKDFAAAAVAIEASYRHFQSQDEVANRIAVPKSYGLNRKDPSEPKEITGPSNQDAEKEARREKLRDIVFGSQFAAAVSMSARNIPEEFGGGGGDMFHSYFSDSHFKSRLQMTDDAVLGKFAKADISLVVTAQSVSGNFGGYKPDSPNKDEQAVAVTVETATRGSYPQQFTYVDRINRPGNIFRYKLWLPKSMGDQFLDMAQKDPTVLQETGDILMYEALEAGQEWTDRRPPYDDWKQANGGIVKTAFRQYFEQSPQESQIVSVAS